MKSIELTEEHKAKILEMCKVLFPKYDHYTFWSEDFVGMYNTDEQGKEVMENNISIHWFEFCMTYLAYKLANIDSEDTFIGDNYRLYDKIMNNEHPIDYLYTKFKKLHNEKT